LSSELASISTLLPNTNNNTNYRVYGDLISQLGKPLDGTTTITLAPSTAVTYVAKNNLYDSLIANESYLQTQHKIDTVIDDLRNGSNPYSNAGEPDLGILAEDIVEPTEVTFDGELASIFWRVVFGVGGALRNLIDPMGAQFIFEGDLGSPLFTGLNLPTSIGVFEWGVSYQANGGLWSQPELILPGYWDYFLSPANAISFYALTSSGEEFSIPTQFVFGVEFNSPGTFSGTLSEIGPSSVPEPSSLAIYAFGFVFLSVLRLRHIL
jgi:hypothetical protein